MGGYPGIFKFASLIYILKVHDILRYGEGRTVLLVNVNVFVLILTAVSNLVESDGLYRKAGDLVLPILLLICFHDVSFITN